MKVAGIQRRIDDLGRIVIPKELRRMVNIKEGDPLEIFISGNKIIMEKYSEISNKRDLADQLVKGFNVSNSKSPFIAIVDTESIISVKTNSNYLSTRLVGKELSQELMGIVNQDEFVYKEKIKDIPETMTVHLDSENTLFVKRIYKISPHVGAIVLFSKDNNGLEITDEQDAIAKYMVNIFKSEDY